MAITLLAHAAAATSDGNPVTTSAVDTSSSKGIAIGLPTYSGNTSEAPTDSESNTWVADTAQIVGGGELFRWFTCLSPATDGSHTFTAPYGLLVLAFGADDTLSLDTGLATGNDGYGTTIKLGSTTPAQASSVTLHGLAWNTDTNTPTIDGSYTIADQFDKTVQHIGGAAAYRIQSSASATDPEWTFDTATSVAGRVTGFVETAGGGGGARARLVGGKLVGGLLTEGLL